MPNLAYAFLGSGEAVVPQGVHADENVGTGLVLFPEPLLEGLGGNIFSAQDALHGLPASTIEDENGNPVLGAVEREDVPAGG
jgi:hypothetical protein